MTAKTTQKIARMQQGLEDIKILAQSRTGSLEKCIVRICESALNKDKSENEREDS